MENYDGIASSIRNVSVSKNMTSPKAEVTAFQVGGTIYSGPPNPEVSMPGIMINTTEERITTSDTDREASLDNTVMVGLSEPRVVFETVASCLMAVLNAEQIDMVMQVVVSLSEENSRTEVRSVIHQEMEKQIQISQDLDAVDLDEIIEQMLSFTGEEDQ